jgi:hypothetical protein
MPWLSSQVRAFLMVSQFLMPYIVIMAISLSQKKRAGSFLPARIP